MKLLYWLVTLGATITLGSPLRPLANGIEDLEISKPGEREFRNAFNSIVNLGVLVNRERTAGSVESNSFESDDTETVKLNNFVGTGSTAGSPLSAVDPSLIIHPVQDFDGFSMPSYSHSSSPAVSDGFDAEADASGAESASTGKNDHDCQFNTKTTGTNKRRGSPPPKRLDPLNYCAEWSGSKPTKHDACIIISNATPYRWRRGYIHSYQMQNWHKKKWPEYIEPGQVLSFYAMQSASWSPENTAAEAAYHIEGTERPMSFMVEYRRGKDRRPWIRFLEDLEAANNPKGSEIDLGIRAIPNGVGFILAGKEGDFVTNNGPAAWMHSMLDDIGDLPLRQIIMGRSHHAGMYKMDKQGFGTNTNSKTQIQDIYSQLHDGGVRVLDVRAMRVQHGSGYRFHECHGTDTLDGWSGGIGASFDEMIDQINRFNDDYPGELIIFDLHAAEAWARVDGSKGLKPSWPKLNATGRLQLYETLKKLNHRISLPAGVDHTTLPLRTFIGDGKSVVIVRVCKSWIEKDGPESFPGAEEGYLTRWELPFRPIWSETGDSDVLMAHQFKWLRKHRPYPGAFALDMQWILNKLSVDNIISPSSILELSNGLWGKAFRDLWGVLTRNQFPNWITVDGIHGTEFKGLIMSANKCFAAGRCGDWAREERDFL